MLLLILSGSSFYGQKNIQVSQNEFTQEFYGELDSRLEELDLEDLRNSEKQVIRIWKPNEIITLSDSVRYRLQVSDGRNNETFVSYVVKGSHYDLDSLYSVFAGKMDLETRVQKRNIDQFPTVVEISTSDSYKIQKFFEQKDLNKILSTIYKDLDVVSIRNTLLNDLPAGSYRLKTTVVWIDHLPEDSIETSSFYKTILEEAKRELGFSATTSSDEETLIVTDASSTGLSSTSNVWVCWFTLSS